MTKAKLTPWLPVEVAPTRVGVYKVSCLTNGQSGKWYCYWNGKYFQGPAHFSANGAIRTARGEPEYRNYHMRSWCGIAKKPEQA